jgi:hypothetical protein
MMFPDTSNDQQLAALRRAAERYRAANCSQVAYQHTTLKPLPSMREELSSRGAYEPQHFISALEELSLSSR